jgi:hypothetical protein
MTYEMKIPKGFYPEEEEIVFEVDDGWFLNPYNEVLYSDWDEYLESIEEWLNGELERKGKSIDFYDWMEGCRGDNPYFEPVSEIITDQYSDYKRGYVIKAKIYKTVKGGFWGYEEKVGETEWVSNEIICSGEIEKKMIPSFVWISSGSPIQESADDDY